MEYEYTAVFDISGEPSTWAPIIETYYPADGSNPVSSNDPLYYDTSYRPYEPTMEQTATQQNVSKADLRQDSGVRFTKAALTSAPAQTSSRWRGRLNRWARCTVGGCVTAGVACAISGPLWVPCFIAWCDGAGVGCLILSW